MANTTPTVHNPTNFDPADYMVLEYLDNQPPQFNPSIRDVEEFAQLRELWKAQMVALYGADYSAKIHRCVHCGNGNVRWITAVRHIPTGNVVTFGAHCTDRLNFANRADWKLADLKRRAAATHQRMMLWQQREAFLAAHPDVADVLAVLDQPVHSANTFAQSIVGSLNRYGNLTERQMTALLTSVARDKERAARMEAEAQEPKGTAPTGRMEIRGVVLSTKTVESQWGYQRKMLLKVVTPGLHHNSKVWLTIPGGADVEREQEIAVTATWTPSEDDPSFGFGKRPILSAA